MKTMATSTAVNTPQRCPITIKHTPTASIILSESTFSKADAYGNENTSNANLNTLREIPTRISPNKTHDTVVHRSADDDDRLTLAGQHTNPGTTIPLESTDTYDYKSHLEEINKKIESMKQRWPMRVDTTRLPSSQPVATTLPSHLACHKNSAATEHSTHIQLLPSDYASLDYQTQLAAITNACALMQQHWPLVKAPPQTQQRDPVTPTPTPMPTAQETHSTLNDQYKENAPCPILPSNLPATSDTLGIWPTTTMAMSRPKICPQHNHITSELSNIPHPPTVNYCNHALNNSALNETRTRPPHLVVTATHSSILERPTNHDLGAVEDAYANKSNPPPAPFSPRTVYLKPTPAPTRNAHLDACTAMPPASYTQAPVTGPLNEVLVLQLHILRQITVILKQLCELLVQIPRTCANPDQRSVSASRSQSATVDANRTMRTPTNLPPAPTIDSKLGLYEKNPHSSLPQLRYPIRITTSTAYPWKPVPLQKPLTRPTMTIITTNSPAAHGCHIMSWTKDHLRPP